jgi:N-methylhydantoinase A
MKRVSVDIGGTFTDCFVAWGDRLVQSKALTTHHHLALGFNEALEGACRELGVETGTLLGEVDSVRYATTLGTNALIERKGPRVGLLVTSGYRHTVAVARARGYGEGLDAETQMDLPMAQRPDPLVPLSLIREVRERVGQKGDVLMDVNDDNVRQQIDELIDAGAEAIVVMLTNGVVNPAHELRVREIFLQDYPAHQLGAIPMLLSHQVAGRKGEYVRAMSSIMDAFLHDVMYHGLGSLEVNLRERGYTKPMLVNHNSGGMAQLNSTDALQTVHSGPVAGIAASENLALSTGLGNVVATDMGGTSFDIGLVVDGGIKFYDFNPVIERWMVSVPMVHLVTLGAGGGSIASYDPMYKSVRIGPQSAGSDPGPACYDRGGLQPTVTDADLLLGYLIPDNYAGGHISLNPRRSRMAFNDALVESLGLDLIDTCKLVKSTVDANMANGIANELRTRGYEPQDFTILAYGGNGPLHACGIANALGVRKVLAPPFSSVFSACGAGSVGQMHLHELSTYMTLFNATFKALLTDYSAFNACVEQLEERGRNDLVRQGVAPESMRFRLELDMRYGNQRVETAVVSPINRLESQGDVLTLIERFHTRYGERFGQGSQAPEAGVRINTIRVCAYVEQQPIRFEQLDPGTERIAPPSPVGTRACHFVGVDGEVNTPVYDEAALKRGVSVDGPALVTTRATTYLVEPGWRLHVGGQQAVWFLKDQ